ncbi:MAG: AMP-binding protein [Defluviitaleaceae bacterium]|nr:AMP-binding protein [Defluviitaleaceae bacterium]
MNILNQFKKSSKIALIQNNKHISFNDLLDKGLCFGGYLSQSGISKGDAVLIFIPLSIQLYQAMIGAWTIGAVPIFVDFSRGVQFVNESVDRLNPKGVIYDRITRLAGIKYPSLKKIKALNIWAKGKSTPIIKLNPEHPAILTFTSGTTGIPKTVIRSHGFLIAQYKLLTKYLDFSQNHIDFATLAVFTLANLASGLTTVLPNKHYNTKVAPKVLAKLIEKEQVTRLICSPKLITDLIIHNSLKTVTTVYLGGAPVYPSVISQIPKHITVHIVYGSTEAEPIAHLNTTEIKEEELEKIKKGYGLLVGHIVSEITCKIGVNNEIFVKGKTVLAKSGAGSWHPTGDTGFFDEQNRLWLTGKVTQTIRDDYGILHPFAVECVLDSYFGIRGAVLKLDGKRVVVISQRGPNEKQILAVLSSFYIERVIIIPHLPMDKRHGAKIDIQRVKQLIENIEI